MKAFKVMATINEQGQLTLDSPLMTNKNSRVEVIVLISEPSEIDEEEQSKASLLQDFRQAWHEAMTGQTIPVAQLWEGLENG
jgi:outer membrane protein W